MLNRLLPYSRYLMIIAIIGSLVEAVVVLGYGGLRLVGIIVGLFQGVSLTGKAGKVLALGFIEIVDLFLVSAALLIIGLGLYELFIDDSLDLPPWLEIHDLDDLKEKLLVTIIAVMAVFFLGQVIAWEQDQSILFLGGGIAVMIAALTYFLKEVHPPDQG